MKITRHCSYKKLPSDITNLAWDNIDRLKETLTAKRTTHPVNGIAMQANVYGPLRKIEKQKQRTVLMMREIVNGNNTNVRQVDLQQTRI